MSGMNKQRFKDLSKACRILVKLRLHDKANGGNDTQIDDLVASLSYKIYQYCYLDYVNNYLTVWKFANDYGVSKEHAELLIDLGKKSHEMSVKEQ